MLINSAASSGSLIIKGSVQQKLRGVEKGVNTWGAGHYFVVLVHLHLVLAIFLFPVSTAQFTE